MVYQLSTGVSNFHACQLRNELQPDDYTNGFIENLNVIIYPAILKVHL